MADDGSVSSGFNRGYSQPGRLATTAAEIAGKEEAQRQAKMRAASFGRTPLTRGELLFTLCILAIPVGIIAVLMNLAGAGSDTSADQPGNLPPALAWAMGAGLLLFGSVLIARLASLLSRPGRLGLVLATASNAIAAVLLFAGVAILMDPNSAMQRGGLPADSLAHGFLGTIAHLLENVPGMLATDPPPYRPQVTDLLNTPGSFSPFIAATLLACFAVVHAILLVWWAGPARAALAGMVSAPLVLTLALVLIPLVLPLV